MQNNIPIQIRVPAELKEQADAVFADIGLKTTDAIRMFLQQTVNRGGLPFVPTGREPNASVLEALEEVRAGGGKVYKTAEELFNDLGI